LIAPFILRIYAFAKKDIIPLSILGELDALPNFSKWAAAVKKHESVTYIWDEEVLVEASVKKLASLKAQRK
jgi:glutathione S-transferase